MKYRFIKLLHYTLSRLFTKYTVKRIGDTKVNNEFVLQWVWSECGFYQLRCGTWAWFYGA